MAAKLENYQAYELTPGKDNKDYVPMYIYRSGFCWNLYKNLELDDQPYDCGPTHDAYKRIPVLRFFLRAGRLPR